MRKLIALVLACLLLITPVHAQDYSAYWNSDSHTYDILVRFKDPGSGTLQEKAEAQQKTILSWLKKGKEEGKVVNYSSFYISNAIHTELKDENLLAKILKRPEVDLVIKNTKVKLVEPIKKKDKAFIYVPDEDNVEWGVKQIQADKVWSAFGLDGTGVTVGIIDTGVNYKLPALKHAYKGYDAATNTFDSSFYRDFIDGLEEPMADHVNDHGTHVMGSILGKEGDKLNQIGVAPGAKFISARVIDDQGAEADTLIAAAQWMLEMHPDVINNSWGGDNDADPFFQDAINAWREAGILPVFAAGNQLPGEPEPGLGSIANPGNLLNVFSVGAIDINKHLGSFSKKGPSAFDQSGNIIKPDVVAPGVQVRSVNALGQYVAYNGTSMATPHVVGVFALLKQANPNASLEQLEQLMRDSAQPLEDEKWTGTPNMAYGYGMINAYDAVAKNEGLSFATLSGHTYQDGQDGQEAAIELLSKTTLYAGRDVTIRVALRDDVSIKDAHAHIKDESITLKRVSGSVSEGVYEAVLPARLITPGKTSLKIDALDFGNHLSEKTYELTILDGIQVPTTFDFEEGLDEFEVEGSFNVGAPVADREPELLPGSKAYVGINIGKSRMASQVDSYLTLPPIKTTGLESLALTFDQYQGFELSAAEIEISYDGKNWERAYEAINRPDITERAWRNDTIVLNQYLGHDYLHVRFYFHSHPADDTVGWYLDNLVIQVRDETAPGQVANLAGQIDSGGFELSFDAREETDLDHYIVLRDDQVIAQLPWNENRHFVEKSEDKASHWQMRYRDKDLPVNGQHTYLVKAVDAFGNESVLSNPLVVSMSSFEPSYSQDFEANDGGYTANGDWQWGVVEHTSSEDEGRFVKEAWQNLQNGSHVWGTNLNGRYASNQDASIVTPYFDVVEGDMFYVDSYTTVSSLDGTSFTVEIQEENADTWTTLLAKDVVHSKLRHWQTLSTSLKKYVGKRVHVRFRAVNRGTYVGPDDLGWYIDNVQVGQAKKTFTETKQSGTISHQANAESSLPEIGIPLVTNIEVLETGHQTTAKADDGAYSLRLPVGAYHVKYSAYGFETKVEEVDLQQGDVIKDVLLKRAKIYNLSGRVIGEDGQAIDDARIRIVSDENIPLYSSEADGSFMVDALYTGDQVVRISKPGYEVVEKRFKAEEDVNLGDIVLVRERQLVDDHLDYAINPVQTEGVYQTLHTVGKLKGAAMRFQSTHQGATLKTVSLFLVNNQFYRGESIKVGVLGYDAQGRLRELVPFQNLKTVKLNDWNLLDVADYQVKTDKPIYVATLYEKGLAESAGVYFDTNASEVAQKRAFFFDGSFISVKEAGVAGAYAMKASFTYHEGAKENTPSAEDDGSVNNENAGFKPLSEEDFIINDEGVITGYTGDETNVRIPKTVRGIRVVGIGDNAFNRLNSDKKLEKVSIPEGVTFIGESAFKNNHLSEVKLPSTLTSIGKSAFQYNYASELKIELPESVTTIEESAFESVARRLILKEMPEVTTIKSNAFAGINDLSLYAPKLVDVADDAFGTNQNLDYVRIYTDSGLQSLDHRYLVNPAYLLVKATDSQDSEKVYRQDVYWSLSHRELRSRSYPMEDFFVQGQTITFTPASFYDEGQKYVAVKPSYELTLERANEIEVPYQTEKALLMQPLYHSDKILYAYTFPNELVQVQIGNDIKEVMSNEDGLVKLPVNLSSVDEITLVIRQAKQKVDVEDRPQSDFVIKDGKIVRYLGNDEDVTLPSSDNDGTITAVGPFAFAGTGIKSVTLPQKLETIETGAFMDSQLESLAYDTKDIDLSVLRSIHAYAFANAKLKTVSFPELLHVIRTSAFENNQLKEVNFSKYLGHIGDKAFKRNKLKKIAIPGNVEEIGVAAFAENELEEVTFTEGPPKGEDADYLSEIPSLAFAHNRLRSISLPDTITFIAEDAFLGNPMNESEVPTPDNPATPQPRLPDEPIMDSSASSSSATRVVARLAQKNQTGVQSNPMAWIVASLLAFVMIVLIRKRGRA